MLLFFILHISLNIIKELKKIQLGGFQISYKNWCDETSKTSHYVACDELPIIQMPTLEVWGGSTAATHGCVNKEDDIKMWHKE